ncbi:MAG: D-aminoacyl-tRNA deacylase [Candidatus Neomarinimicrobiota bacterium]|nr:D-aminoacyl-tRNA deacylase [Candidatus Neomarinimicrobiota bacterium]MEC9273330.1 D-aminoacyl-tRNA deacylase [Candidatus Neomarinimicrobiota bacterium]|tara:strand:- start:215 stop:661 length:447 start_codon:yes stop_codon:yes gene_type:complete
MTAVIQRVINANVKINNSEERSISNGLVILLGIHKDDTEQDISYLVDKIIGLRIFNDDNDKMNYSLLDIDGSVLIISQFTLCADLRRGRRPSFINASDPKKGKVLYNNFVQMFKRKGLNVKTGEFGAHMNVNLINNGPVTFVIDTNDI